MSIGIYKIENLINHKVYIGQSIHIEKRWQQHCQLSSDSVIAKAIQKYGKENFSFQILEECSEQDLDKKELFYIKSYNSLVPNGYNIIDYIDGQRRIYNNYDRKTLYQIIADIKDTDMSFQDIAAKYNLDTSMIYYLNRGDYHTLEEFTYPLREVKSFKKQYHYCIDCGKEIGKGALRCISCANKAQQTCERPSRQILKDMIRTMSFEAIGRKYGVSGNAIRKWCIQNDLPSKKSDIKQFSDEMWAQI